MWREAKTNDYKFIDRAMKSMYDCGGVGVLCHKYLGPSNTGPSDDATKPQILNPTERSIQDLLFMENRDRKYDSTIYNLRGIYTKSDADFDLSQFGLFLSSDTIFMTFPLNEMVRIVGRKIMSGDVLELTHLQDDYADVADVPIALKRYYVVGDCSWPAEGFSPIWYPHLWRAKLTPLVDSQEYKSILNSIKIGNTNTPIVDILSQFNKYKEINDAVVAQAEADVPLSGYDVSTLYTRVDEQDEPDPALGLPLDTVATPMRGDYEGYLTGDALAPNGHPVTSGVSFPLEPEFGAYHLRLDYLPNRLFRYDGARWIMVEDKQRTPLSKGTDNKTLKNSFVNNTNTFVDENNSVQSELQSLNEILRAKPN